jgi:hypothetical protein
MSRRAGRCSDLACCTGQAGIPNTPAEGLTTRHWSRSALPIELIRLAWCIRADQSGDFSRGDVAAAKLGNDVSKVV